MELRLSEITHTSGDLIPLSIPVQIFVSEDGVNFTEVAKASSKTPQYLGESFVCRFEAVNARYVRVKLLDNKPGGGTGFAEIEVFAS